MHLLFFFVTGEAARSLFNSDRDLEECPPKAGQQAIISVTVAGSKFFFKKSLKKFCVVK
jgi:hypothetical protein